MAETGVIGVSPGSFPNLPPLDLPALPSDNPPEQNQPLKITIGHSPVRIADNTKSDDWFGSSVVPSEALENTAQPSSQSASKDQSSTATDWFASSVVPSETIEQGEAPAPSQPQKPDIGVGEDIKNTLLGQTLPMAAVAPLGAITYPLRMVQDAGNWLDKHVANLDPEQSEPDARQPWAATPNEMLSDTAEAIGHPLYNPQTTTGKYVDTLGQFLLGGGWMGAANKAKSLTDVAKNVGKTIIPSLIGGAASETAGQFTQGTSLEEPARIISAVAAGHAPMAAKGIIEPLTPNGRTRMATSDIMSNAQNPDQLNQAIQSTHQINNATQESNPASQIAPQQNRTVAELAPYDQGLAMHQNQVLKSAQAIGGNDFAAQLNDIQTARQDANQKFLQAMQSGNPEDVGQFFTSHIDQLNQEHDGMMNAQKAISGTLNPEGDLSDAGGSATSQFEAGRAAAKAAEDKAWDELEPYKQIPADASLIQDQATANSHQIDPMAGDAMHPVEQHLYNTVNAWGNDPQPFGRVTSFARNLNDAISEVGRQQGFKSSSVQRLMKLKDSVKKTVSGKVGEIHAAEAQLAQEGRMSPEDTIFHHLINKAESWRANRQAESKAGGAGGSRPRGPSRGGPQAFHSPDRTAIPSGGQSPNAAGNQSLPRPSELALKPHEAFGKANKSTQERASTFDNPKALREAFAKQNNEYKLTEGQRAEKFFRPGEGGGEAVKAAKGAGISKETLQDIALNKLRKDGVLNSDGSINTTKLQKWQDRHATALKELPELKQKLSGVQSTQDALAENASKNRALKESFDESAASKFVGNEKPEKVIGKILGGNNPMANVTDLLSRVGKDQKALDGLRAATLKHLEEKFSGSDKSASKSAKYKQYLSDNKAVLERLLSKPSFAMLNKIIDEDINNIGVKNTKSPQKETLFRGIKKLFHGHAGEASAVGASLLAEHGTHIISSHPLISAVSGLGIVAKALHSSGMNKLSQLKADMVLHPDVYASAFSDYMKDKGAPLLLQRNFASSMMRIAPSAEAIAEERQRNN